MISVISSGGSQGPTAASGAVSYQFPQFGGGVAWGATETQRRDTCPIDCSLSKLSVRITTDPGAGASWTFELLKNGVATGVTVTISTGGALYQQDGVNTVSVSKGDSLSLKATASATAPAAPGAMEWAFYVTATTSGESLIMGSNVSTVGSNVTTYIALQNDGTADTSAANRSSVFPTGGTLDHLYVDLDGALGVADTVTITLYNQSGATVLQAVLTGAVSSGSDLTHSVAVAAGDVLYWQIATSAVITNARRVQVGVRFVPTIPGESVALSSSASTQAQNLTRYWWSSGGISGGNGTEANRQSMVLACTVKKLFAYLAANVGGSAQTYTVTGRVNSGDYASSITFAISTGAATGNDTTHSNVVVDGDQVATKAVTSATTGTVQPAFGFVMYIAPASTVTYPQWEYAYRMGSERQPVCIGY